MNNILSKLGKEPGQTTIFIIGQVKGIPELIAREKFNEAKSFYESEGFQVLTPFDVILKKFGHKKFNERQIGAACIDVIANEADIVAVLSNYLYSDGAQVENDFCIRYKIPRVHAGTFEFVSPLQERAYEL